MTPLTFILVTDLVSESISCAVEALLREFRPRTGDRGPHPEYQGLHAHQIAPLEERHIF